MESNTFRNRDLCIAALESLRQSIPVLDYSRCSHFIKRDEWGLALESLMGCLVEEQIQIDRDQFSSIHMAATAMELLVPEQLESQIE